MTSAGRFLVPLVLAMLAGDIAAAEDASATFPNRPIRMIVPFPAGRPSDIVARLIGQKMSEDWGQPVVIDIGREATRSSLRRPRRKQSPTATRCSWRSIRRS